MSTFISPLGSASDSLVARLPAMPAAMAEMRPAPASDGPSAVSPGTEGFGTLLTRAVRGLAEQTGSADRLQELAASGQLPDPTVAVIATEKADLSLRMAIQVRNRLLEGWNDLARMPL